MMKLIKFAAHTLLSKLTWLGAINFIIEVFINGILETILKHLFNKHLAYYF